MVAYFGIGLHLGRANPQNKKAHLIGHIKDINGNPHDPITRIYTTSIAQPFHTDISDIVGEPCAQMLMLHHLCKHAMSSIQLWL